MPTGNVKLDAPLDFYDKLADILGQTHPDDYEKNVLSSASTAAAVPIAGTQPPTLARRPMLGRLPSAASMPASDPMEYNAPRAMAPDLAAPPIQEPAIVPRRTLASKTRGVFGTIGQIAGSAFVPNLMQWIPGTEQRRILEEDLAQG